MYTPPIRAPFFEAEVELPGKNPSLPAAKLPVRFLRNAREWISWVKSIADAVGSPVASLTVVATLDFGNIAAGASADLTVTVAGVRATDPQPIVEIGTGAFTAGLVFRGYVSANNTVTVRCTNASTGAIDPASASYRIEVRRYA